MKHFKYLILSLFFITFANASFAGPGLKTEDLKNKNIDSSDSLDVPSGTDIGITKEQQAELKQNLNKIENSKKETKKFLEELEKESP